jgi:hypothetical protein
MGGIGGNDYYSYFIAGKPSKDGNIIPDVIAYIEHFIEVLARTPIYASSFL